VKQLLIILSLIFCIAVLGCASPNTPYTPYTIDTAKYRIEVGDFVTSSYHVNTSYYTNNYTLIGTTITLHQYWKVISSKKRFHYDDAIIGGNWVLESNDR
jgi:hypothetical protein